MESKMIFSLSLCFTTRIWWDMMRCGPDVCGDCIISINWHINHSIEGGGMNTKNEEFTCGIQGILRVYPNFTTIMK